MYHRIVLVSPLPIDDVRQRLHEAVGSDWSFRVDQPVKGSVGKNSFRIRTSINYRNSFQTMLYGRMRAEGEQTRLECAARMSSFVIAFMIFWFGFLASFGVGPYLRAMISDNPMPEFDMLMVAMPSIMLVFGVALVWFGRWLARNEEAQLVKFLEETVDAQPA